MNAAKPKVKKKKRVSRYRVMLATRPEFYAPRQAAAVLGVSYATIVRAVQRGELRAERFGKNMYLVEAGQINAAAKRAGKTKLEIRAIARQAAP